MTEESKDVVMTIRIPSGMAQRIRRLRPHVEKQRAFIMKSNVTRSDLVRYALLRGIEELEGAVSESTATTSD
jgi:predicted DNA-binding protein